MRDPRTSAEWQVAVDLAEFFLALDSARKYGLMTGGPEVDLARCEGLLARGRAKGIRPALPSPGSRTTATRSWWRGWSARVSR